MITKKELEFTLELPPHYDPAKIASVWRVPYSQRAEVATIWAEKQHIKPAAMDDSRIALLIVDTQNTFCLPEFEL
ncbi:MAG: hypothetical protein ABFD53_09785, partial [Anaerolineaceae bacterium]